MSDLEHKVEFQPAYDHRDKNPHGGCHGVDVRFLVKGELGAVQFVLSTGWMLPRTLGLDGELDAMGMSAHHYRDAVAQSNIWYADGRQHGHYPMPVDLGFHSPKPMYDGQEPLGMECDVLGLDSCYYDGSTLNAWRPFGVLLERGSDGVFEYLESYYESTFAAA